MCFPFENVGVSTHGVPQNGWFIVEHPIKRDDLGGSLFQETSIYIQSLKKIYIYIYICIKRYKYYMHPSLLDIARGLHTHCKPHPTSCL